MSGMDSYDQQAATNLHRLIEEKRQTTRTPDPAQIRADAIREAAGVLNAQYKRALALSDKDLCHDGKSYAAAAYGWSEQAILALIDTPLSPPAVDNSPAPDAGGKKPCGECFIPENEICDICGAVGPSGKAGGKEGV